MGEARAPAEAIASANENQRTQRSPLVVRRAMGLVAVSGAAQIIDQRATATDTSGDAALTNNLLVSVAAAEIPAQVEAQANETQATESPASIDDLLLPYSDASIDTEDAAPNVGREADLNASASPRIVEVAALSAAPRAAVEEQDMLAVVEFPASVIEQKVETSLAPCQKPQGSSSNKLPAAPSFVHIADKATA